MLINENYTEVKKAIKVTKIIIKIKEDIAEVINQIDQCRQLNIAKKDKLENLLTFAYLTKLDSFLEKKATNTFASLFSQISLNIKDVNEKEVSVLMPDQFGQHLNESQQEFKYK